MNKEEMQAKLKSVLEENNIHPEEIDLSKDLDPEETGVDEVVLINQDDIVDEEDDDISDIDPSDEVIEFTEEELEMELFPDGPTIGQIQEWKDIHGNIFLSDIGSETFIWRLLTRSEFKSVASQKAGPYEREEQYCEMCCLWPENYGFMEEKTRAGVPSILAEEILSKSGFKPNHVPIQL